MNVILEVMIKQCLDNTDSAEQSYFMNSFLHQVTNATAVMQKEWSVSASKFRKSDNSHFFYTSPVPKVVCTQKNALTIPIWFKLVQHCPGLGFRVEDFSEVTKLLQ